MKCLLCNCPLAVHFSLSDLFTLTRIQTDSLCKDCRQRFVPYDLNKNCCCGCGHPAGGSSLCQECLKWKQQFGRVLHHQPLFHYNDAMAEYMSQYKFQGRYQLRMAFQQQVQITIAHYDYDLLVPIPVSKNTWQTRGFNQVEGLIEDLKFVRLLSTIDDYKTRQSSRSRQERLATAQPFCLAANAQVTGQSVLLVDDVYTTGRTLYHAADLFWQAGCQHVKSLSLAR